MGSAASVSEGSPSPAHPGAAAVVAHVEELRAVLQRIAHLSLTPGDARDFIRRHSTADVKQLLAMDEAESVEVVGRSNVGGEATTVPKEEVSTLALKLGAAVLTGALEAACARPDEAAKHPAGHGHDAPQFPEGPLRDFLPIGSEPLVKEVVDSPVLSKEAQRAFGIDPTDAASAAELRAAALRLANTMRRTVERRCNEEEGIADLAHRVVEAANADFLPVYESVWERIFRNEQANCDAFQKVAAAITFPAQGQAQEATDPVELLVHAAAVKPAYDQIIDRIVRSVDGAEASIPDTLKNITRIVEKAVLNAENPGNCTRVFDIVRGMVVCQDMACVTSVLDKLAKEKDISLVRMKERFFQNPSPGGWRDCMVCFVVPGGGRPLHVCELQIAHRDLLTARKGLPGHAVYNRARNAAELLEVMHECKTYFDPPWTLEATRRAGFAGDDYKNAGMVTEWWGSPGQLLLQLHECWKHLPWGYKTRPLLPVTQWQGVSVEESRLVGLELGHVDFGGTIPSQIGNCVNLQTLHLQSNDFTGHIPSEMGGLTNLVDLNLSMNQLTGTIPSQLGQCASLVWLSLRDNKLTGVVPGELGLIRSLEIVDLANNTLQSTQEFEHFMAHCVPCCLVSCEVDEPISAADNAEGAAWQFV